MCHCDCDVNKIMPIMPNRETFLTIVMLFSGKT